MKIKEESIGTVAIKNLFKEKSPNIFEYIHVIKAAENIDAMMTIILETNLEITMNSLRIGLTNKISRVLFSISLVMALEATITVKNPPIWIVFSKNSLSASTTVGFGKTSFNSSGKSSGIK